MSFIKEMDAAIALWIKGDLQAAIFDSSDEELFEFVTNVALISRHYSTPNTQQNENFSFIVNSALSGGMHPCAAFECRMTKIDQLVSFASLYADEVYIQSPFENLYLRGEQKFRVLERNEILAGIHTYLYLKPLIGAGILKYASVNVGFCLHHLEEIAKPLSESIRKKEDRLYEVLEKFLIERCKVTFDYVEGNKRKPFFEITGPNELIEHGKVYFHAFEPLSELYLSFMGNGVPYVLKTDEVKSSGVLAMVIDPIINDLSTQEWHSALNGTSYLCDSKTQIKVASKINSHAYAANSAAFEGAMKHYLPAIYTNDVSAILRLRNKEEEAFAVYRDRLNKIMSETKMWSEDEVSRVFRDQVLPEINIINKKVSDWKASTRESIAEKVLFGAGAASFGLYGGMLPSTMGEMVAAIGGASAVAGTLMDYNKSLKEKTEARKNDFYFLWQASK